MVSCRTNGFIVSTNLGIRHGWNYHKVNVYLWTFSIKTCLLLLCISRDRSSRVGGSSLLMNSKAVRRCWAKLRLPLAQASVYNMCRCGAKQMWDALPLSTIAPFLTGWTFLCHCIYHAHVAGHWSAIRIFSASQATSEYDLFATLLE